MKKKQKKKLSKHSYQELIKIILMHNKSLKWKGRHNLKRLRMIVLLNQPSIKHQGNWIKKKGGKINRINKIMKEKMNRIILKKKKNLV